jgi:hypothetical protein
MSTIQVTNINDLSDNAALVTDNGGIKTDKLTGKTTAGSISVVGEGNSTTTNLQNGLLKGFAFYVQSSDSLSNTFNIASATDNATGDAYLNLTNNVAGANEPHTGSGVGSANTTVIGYEANSNSTSSSRRYNTTNSAAGDALSDASTYTLIGGELA